MMIVNEENVSVKISMPLVDDIELQRIDTFYNDIVSEYTKAFVKEKDQVIAQRLMMNLQRENARLKNKIEKAINFVDKYMDEWDFQDEVWQDMNNLLILLKEN